MTDDEVPTLTYEEAIDTSGSDGPEEPPAAPIGPILAGMNGAVVTAADDERSWVVSIGTRQIRVTEKPQGDDDPDLQITTPVMVLPAGQRVAFLRRLLELNDPTMTGPAALFLEGDEVCFGVARGLEGLDQGELEYLVTMVSLLPVQLEAGLRKDFDLR